MRDLKKRLKGLIAIFLSVCICFELSILDVHATTYSITYDSDTQQAGLAACVLRPGKGDSLSGVTGGVYLINNHNDVREYINTANFHSLYDAPNDSLDPLGQAYQDLYLSDAVTLPAGQHLAVTPTENSEKWAYFSGDKVWTHPINITLSIENDNYTLKYYHTASNTEHVSVLATYSEAGVPLAASDPGFPERVSRGKHITGWELRGTVYDAGATIPADVLATYSDGDEIILQASWNENEITVNYDLNGGDGLVPQASPMSATDPIAALPSGEGLTRPRYQFAGWAINPGVTITYGPGSSYDIPYRTDELPNSAIEDGDTVTFYAVWSPYTVNFQPGWVEDYDFEPTGIMAPRYSDEVAALPECGYTLANYHCSGWKMSNSDGMAEGDLLPIGSALNYAPRLDEDDVYLQAQWEPNKVTVTYDANGGIGSIPDSFVEFSEEAPDEIELTSPIGSISREGYLFKGWSLDPADSDNLVTAHACNYVEENTTTYYAIWEPNPFYVHFNANGGSGEMADQVGASGNPFVLNANQFTNVEQIFAGWATTSDSDVQYADQATFEFLATTVNQRVDLFAIWTKLFKVAFDANSGTGAMDTLLSNVAGQNVNLPANAFTKEGYTFVGWSTNKDATVADIADGAAYTYNPTVAGETVTLYAIWKEVEPEPEPEPEPTIPPDIPVVSTDPIMLGAGTYYLTTGQAYCFAGNGVYSIQGDITNYPCDLVFYVPTSGYYTINVN